MRLQRPLAHQPLYRPIWPASLGNLEYREITRLQIQLCLIYLQVLVFLTGLAFINYLDTDFLKICEHRHMLSLSSASTVAHVLVVHAIQSSCSIAFVRLWSADGSSIWNVLQLEVSAWESLQLTCTTSVSVSVAMRKVACSVTDGETTIMRVVLVKVVLVRLQRYRRVPTPSSALWWSSSIAVARLLAPTSDTADMFDTTSLHVEKWRGQPRNTWSSYKSSKTCYLNYFFHHLCHWIE